MSSYNLQVGTKTIQTFQNGLARTEQVEFPTKLSNFANCAANTVYCCFVTDRQANDGNGNIAITRSLSLKLGTQTLIPDHFLAGVLPAALVERYTFWQGEGDNLIGDEKFCILGDSQPSSSGALTRLKVTLLKSPDLDKTGFAIQTLMLSYSVSL